jgi:hypothetical protein
VFGDAPLDPDTDAQVAQLRELIEQMVHRAKRAGALRTDVMWRDIAFLLAATTTGTDTMGLRLSAEQWRLNLRVILDGLRAPTTWSDVPVSRRAR